MIRSAELLETDEQRALYAKSLVYHYLIDLVRQAEAEGRDTRPIIRRALVQMATKMEEMTATLVSANLERVAAPLVAGRREGEKL